MHNAATYYCLKSAFGQRNLGHNGLLFPEFRRHGKLTKTNNRSEERGAAHGPSLLRVLFSPGLLSLISSALL